MHIQKTGILEVAPTPQEDIESIESLALAPSVAAIAWHVRRMAIAAMMAGEPSPYERRKYKATPHPWDRSPD